MLKLDLYGQNDSQVAPADQTTQTNALALTGDPGTDNTTLTNAGFLGGKIVAITGYTGDSATSSTTFAALISPCDASIGQKPYGTLINGPGDFSSSITPAGSGRTPIVRGMWKGAVDSQAYNTSSTYTLGKALYCGGSTADTAGNKGVGLYMPLVAGTGAGGPNTDVVGICTHVPSTNEPWLGIASTL